MFFGNNPVRVSLLSVLKQFWFDLVWYIILEANKEILMLQNLFQL
jgi:hypothetical protein